MCFHTSFIHIKISTKNKYNIDITFKFYCKKYWGKDFHKKAIPTFCWWENKEELYTNIVNSIENKNKKLINEYIPKLKEKQISYDKYSLVVYGEGISAELDEECLYKEIIKINNLQYNEIAIFLWNKLLVINETGFNIYSTQKE